MSAKGKIMPASKKSQKPIYEKTPYCAEAEVPPCKVSESNHNWIETVTSGYNYPRAVLP